MCPSSVLRMSACKAVKRDAAGLAIKLKISTVVPDDSGVHVDHALRDQIAHQ